MFSKSYSVYARGAVAVLVLILLSCTEKKTYVTNNPPTDQRPPLVEWISPQGGSAVQGTVSLTFMARDESGIDSARLYLDGTSRADFGVAGSNDSIYTFLWDTRSDSDGQKSLVCRAFDHYGNVGETPALVLYVHNQPQPPAEDHIPPQVTWVSPTGGSEVSGSVAVALSAWDAGGIDSMKLYINGVFRVGSASSPDSASDSSQAGRLTYAWNTLQDSDGVYVLDARAWDKAGNAGETPALLLRIHNNPAPPGEDHTPPDLWWEAPVAGTTLSDTTRLIVHWFDESGVDSMRLMMDGAAVGQVFNLSGHAGIVSYLWDTRNDSDGVHLWEARGWDVYGNTGVSAALLVRVKNHAEPPVDYRPPVIVWVAPQPGDTVQGSVDIHFQVMDDGGLDSAWVYVNGRLLQNLLLSGNFSDNVVIWVTKHAEETYYIDGQYVVSVEATDRSGNRGLSRAVVLQVWNNRPRVIWVPDDYQTIQGAINASRDRDTVRVRSGTYHEQLQFFDKIVSIMSESGPEETTIDGTGFYTAAWMVGGQDTTVLIRGFTFSNSSDFICYGAVFDGSSPKIENNIFTANGVQNCNGFHMDQNDAIMRNNLFISLRDGIEIGHSFGADFSNNMILHTYDYTIYNRAINGQFLIPDYNLIWDYNNLWNAGWGPHNIIDQEPQFIQGTYVLQPGSPGVNQGRPDILDPDESISDIGVYGGPLQYPPPNQ